MLKTAPFRMSTWTAQDVVCKLKAEAYPERLAVGGDAHYFMVSNDNSMNWAHAVSTWGSTVQDIPAVPGTSAVADPATTTSDFTGLNYVSLLGNRGDGGTCVAVGAISSDRVDTNDWTQYGGMRCISPGDSSDGTMIEYDIGGSDLWVVDWDLTALNIDIQIHRNCRAGAVGCCVDATCTSECTPTATEQCPVRHSKSTGSLVRGHPGLAVNPCTHNGLIVYESQTNEVRMSVYNASGSFIANHLIASGQASTQNTTCSLSCGGGDVRTCVGTDGLDCGDNCTSGTTCMRRSRRPQIVTSALSNTSGGSRCYAYITWEATATASDGNVYWNDNLKIFDITSDTAPVTQFHWLGKQASQAWNHYGSQIAVSSLNVAWVKFTDVNGPCTVNIIAHGDINGAFATLTDWGTLNMTSFPAMRAGVQSGWLDWTSTVGRGVGLGSDGRGGSLLATWTQPICRTSGTCSHCAISGCATGEFGWEIKGVVITP